jgi:3-hydroxyacyl-[acyl-carrier-protein] dehydratase
MLLNRLYSIKSLLNEENNTILAEIRINKADKIFAGHFPDKPVMPGVCLINMITDVISVSKNAKYSLKSAEFVKFIQVVLPEKNSDLFLRLVKNETGTIVNAEGNVFCGELLFLKFKGSFEKI